MPSPKINKGVKLAPKRSEATMAARRRASANYRQKCIKYLGQSLGNLVWPTETRMNCEKRLASAWQGMLPPRYPSSGNEPLFNMLAGAASNCKIIQSSLRQLAPAPAMPAGNFARSLLPAPLFGLPLTESLPGIPNISLGASVSFEWSTYLTSLCLSGY